MNSWINNNSENGEPLLKGSNIIDGQNEIIFQDKFKNLWTMGNNTSLQVLRLNQNGDGYNENIGWTSAINSGLTNNSNITNNNDGIIFQDDFGNLWAMGSKKLQVLKINVDKNGYVDSWQKTDN